MSTKKRDNRLQVRLLAKDDKFMSTAAKKLGGSKSDAARVGAFLLSRLTLSEADSARREYRAAAGLI